MDLPGKTVVVYHIHYLDYCGLPYRLFGLVWIGDLDSGLTGEDWCCLLYTLFGLVLFTI